MPLPGPLVGRSPHEREIGSDEGGPVTEIAIIALFAVSLDLILGYAGIASLGHTAFFGAGAYAAGLFAIHVTNDPLLGLVHRARV